MEPRLFRTKRQINLGVEVIAENQQFVGMLQSMYMQALLDNDLIEVVEYDYELHEYVVAPHSPTAVGPQIGVGAIPCY